MYYLIYADEYTGEQVFWGCVENVDMFGKLMEQFEKANIPYFIVKGEVVSRFNPDNYDQEQGSCYDSE